MDVVNSVKHEQILSELKVFFARKKILVTGATGFLGSHLCDSLTKFGANVIIFSRNAQKHIFPPGISSYSVDLRNLHATQDAVQALKPQLVYHLASLVNTRQEMGLLIPTFENNVTGSINLFSALIETGCERIVFTGSSEEPDVGRFGSAANSPYAASKEAAMVYAAMLHKVFSLPVVLTRPFMSYGPRQSDEKLIPYSIINLLKKIPPQISSGRRICDLIYIEDLVTGLLLAGSHSGIEGEHIDLGTGIGTTIHDVVQLVADTINCDTQPLFGAIPDRLYELPQVADIKRTEDILGFSPHWSLAEGISTTVTWYKERMKIS